MKWRTWRNRNLLNYALGSIEINYVGDRRWWLQIANTDRYWKQTYRVLVQHSYHKPKASEENCGKQVGHAITGFKLRPCKSRGDWSTSRLNGSLLSDATFV